MTDKELKFEITKRIQQGDSKAELYDQFKNDFNNETLRKILASRPSYELALKFKKTHITLSIIWGIFILLELLGIMDLVNDFDLKFLISLFVSIYITINIWRFDARFFLPGIIWFIFTIFNVFIEIAPLKEYSADFDFLLIITFSYSLILILGIYLMYLIKKNVFGYYNWFQPEVDNMNESVFE